MLAERLNGDDPDANAAQMTAKTFPDDPIMAHYGSMCEFGALVTRYLTLEQVESVVDGWYDAVQAAERGDIHLAPQEMVNWQEHLGYAITFLDFLRRCHGLDSEGEPLPSVRYRMAES